MTDQDRADLEKLGIDPETGEQPATQRSVLELWSEILSNVELVSKEKIPAQVAAKVVASWPKLSFQDTARYHERYHEILGGMRDSLKETLRLHPDALKNVGDDDAVENHAVYRDQLVEWTCQLDQIEQDWDAVDPESHIELAAVIDARAFIFSEMGFAGHLGAIGFSLGEDEFLEALSDAKGEK